MSGPTRRRPRGIRTGPILAAMVAVVAGCSESPESLGRPIPDGEAVAIRSILSDPASRAGEEVLLEGTLVEVCPTAGGWADLEDSGGDRIRLELSTFTLEPAHRGKACAVAGKVSVATSPPRIYVHGIRLGEGR